MKGGIRMIKKTLQLLTAIALVCAFSISCAVPAQCGSYVTPYLTIASNDGAVLNVDIGDEIPKKARVGGQVVTVQASYYCDHFEHCHNLYYFGCNQYLATNTNSCGPELPYSKISTACPWVRQVLTNAANSYGFIPGDAFEIEIGKFTNYNGYTPCTSLNIPMNYEVYYRQVDGYVPGMIALLPNGTVTVLNDVQFDRSTLGNWYIDGTRMFSIHTLYPQAVYMMVFMPAK